MNFKTIEVKDKKLILLDQTVLPGETVYNSYDDYRDVIDAIKRLEVRGAPAIGIAAAYALALAVEIRADYDLTGLKKIMADVAREIKSARPTAVNLAWAVDRCLSRSDLYDGESIDEYRDIFWKSADEIHAEDIKMCDAMGRFGADLIPDGATVLTHCNAGALATGGIGTALAVFYKAKELGKKIKVFADETRPLLQGARLTCWELMQAGIDVTLLTDNMAGYAMAQGKIDAVITGADRITKNGDVANKIGTYAVAVLAREHNIPFYVAAPESTFDKELESGSDIIIEEREPSEVTNGFGKPTAPEGVKVYSPAFDITPHSLVTAYITDTGIRPGGRAFEGFEVSNLRNDAFQLAGYLESFIEEVDIKIGEDHRKVMVAVLYAKILSGMQSVNMLCKNYRSIEAEIVARTVLEALFYMAACAKSEDLYLEYIQRSLNNLQWIYKDVIKDNQIYSKDLQDGIRKIYEQAQERNPKLDFKDKKSIKEIAQKTGLEVIYGYSYRIMSDAIHSDPAYLQRQFTECEDGLVIGINIGENASREEDVLFNTNIAGLESTKIYADIFDLKIHPLIQKMITKYEEYGKQLRPHK